MCDIKYVFNTYFPNVHNRRPCIVAIETCGEILYKYCSIMQCNVVLISAVVNLYKDLFPIH